MSRNGSRPDLDVDDPPRHVLTIPRRLDLLEQESRTAAEERGEILAYLARIERLVGKRRPWSAKEWATLIAAVAAALTASGGVLAHFLGK